MASAASTAAAQAARRTAVSSAARPATAGTSSGGHGQKATAAGTELTAAVSRMRRGTLRHGSSTENAGNPSQQLTQPETAGSEAVAPQAGAAGGPPPPRAPPPPPPTG